MNFGIGTQIYESETIRIHRGYRTLDHAPVIIKSLRQEYPKPTDVAKLKYERTIAASLALPGVVKIHAVEKLGNHLALIMEDFGGVALDHWTGAQRLSLKQLLRVAIAVADTLGAVHARGVIHRDIKPHKVRPVGKIQPLFPAPSDRLGERLAPARACADLRVPCRQFLPAIPA